MKGRISRMTLMNNVFAIGLAIRKSSAIMRVQIHEVEMAVPQEIQRLLERYDVKRKQKLEFLGMRGSDRLIPFHV